MLNVYSPTCPDLTLVDLPGVTRVPVGKQPKNIEEITKKMAKRYCEDPLTIILCVIAANSDIATSDGLKMAKEIDVNGVRTLGVLTKLDIMDAGTDARKALMGEEIPLKLGYVGVKNRSKQDLVNKIPMAEAFKKEKEFFSTHPVYKKMSPGYTGTDVLIKKLTKVFFRVIREHLPNIIRAINDNIRKCEEELSLLGQPMPVDDAGKLSMLWNMLNEYCEIYRNVLEGRYDSKRLSFLRDEGGYKVKALFKNLLDEYTGDYKATANYKDENIDYALTIHEGDSIPGFPSVDAFYYLLKPQLEVIKEPINETFANVFSYLEMLSSKILERTFSRFPRVIDDISEMVSKFLNEEKDKAKYMVDCIIDMEINYLFTNDYDYMTNYTTFIPKNQEQNQEANAHLTSRQIFIREIRNRIEAYFKLIVRNLRDSIPKSIGYNLVLSIQENMQMHLYDALYKSQEIVAALNEPEGIKRQREELTRQIRVMKDAQKVIRRDPDLMSVMNIDISDNEISEHGNRKKSEAEKKPEPSAKVNNMFGTVKKN